jgi:hypothetical protein
MLKRLLQNLPWRRPRHAAGSAYRYPMVLPRDNRRLSADELSRAAAICEDAARQVRARDDHIREGLVDARFALPDANWSYDAPNEFLGLFRRVVRAERDVLEHFRGFCQVFSGFNLYQVRLSLGIVSADLELTADLDARVAEALQARNPQIVEAWQESTTGIPRRYLLSLPVLLGECGHMVDGLLVNYETHNYQQRANLIYRSGLARWIEQRIERRGEVRICEIGGGFGALALWFKQAFPGCSYTVVDLPECLLFSRLYLGLNRPDVHSGFRFVPNYKAGELEEPFDLVVNTLSMSEMSRYQVEAYAGMIAQRWLRDGGLFFEQNVDARHMNLLFAQEVLAPYFPERVTLAPEGRLLNNGAPNLWSLQPIEL